MRLMTPRQSRAARAVLSWSLPDASRESGISPNTISRFELGNAGHMDTAIKLREAYEKAGVLFPDTRSIVFEEQDPPRTKTKSAKVAVS
jgi:transcriptional regulator with XRE-family HTH domain